MTFQDAKSVINELPCNDAEELTDATIDGWTPAEFSR